MDEIDFPDIRVLHEKFRHFGEVHILDFFPDNLNLMRGEQLLHILLGEQHALICGVRRDLNGFTTPLRYLDHCDNDNSQNADNQKDTGYCFKIPHLG